MRFILASILKFLEKILAYDEKMSNTNNITKLLHLL